MMHDTPASVLNQINELLKDGRPVDADRIAASALETHQGNFQILFAAATCKKQLGLWEESLGLFRKAALLAPRSASAPLHICDIQIMLGQSEAAEESLGEALRIGGDDTHYRRRDIALGQLLGDHHRVIGALLHLIEQGHRGPQALHRLRQACLEGGTDATKVALDRVKASNPVSLEACVLEVVLAEQEGDLELLTAAIRQLNAEHPDSRTWGAGTTSLARQLALPFSVNFVSGAPVKHDDRFPSSDAAPLRPLVVDDPESDLLTARSSDDRALAIVFTGLADRFQLPLEVFDSYLAGMGIGAVYLRDFQRLLYLEGIKSLGSKEATLDVLRSLAGNQKTVLIGSSAGGYGALLFAPELRVERTVCFSPITNIRPEFLERIFDPRVTGGYGVLLKRLLLSAGPEAGDLAPGIRASRCSVFNLIYGAENATDAAHSEHLRDVPGVKLHPLSGISTHSVIPPLTQRGDFQSMLRDILGIDPDVDHEELRTA